MAFQKVTNLISFFFYNIIFYSRFCGFQLQDDPMLKNSYLRKNAFKQYFELVNNMFVYENELFDKYLAKATYMANVEVRKNILSMEVVKKQKGSFVFLNFFFICIKF